VLFLVVTCARARALSSMSEYNISRRDGDFAAAAGKRPADQSAGMPKTR
jgi:hypothetical protein